ncbi:AAA family ATPase [Rhodococcus pyridinivorans]|uniref:AAA family ATPase n=1 Tax=Rhodococcus pyridinivorans TaxID=103816 RepID=UPI0013656037|nr:AAA family ATPase [Rhodococcus pyridinivorans]
MVKIMRVDSINDFRIFHNWRSGPDTPDFDHVTLVHANNGSGKSTLARLLSPATDASGWDAGVTVTVEEAGSTRQVTSPDHPCWQNVVVFNQDYVQRAVRVHDGTADALLTLGPDAVQRQKALEETQEDLTAASRSREEAQEESKNTDRALSDYAKKVADEINRSLNYRYGRGYNASSVKKEIDTGLDDATRSAVDEQALLSRARAAQLDLQQVPSLPPAITVSVLAVRDLLTETPSVPPTGEISLTPTQRDWITTGAGMHDAGDSCIFCAGTVTQERLDELQELLTLTANSLSERARQMAQQLSTDRDAVDRWLTSIPLSSAGVYPDLDTRYSDALEAARKSGKQFQDALDSARRALIAKSEDIHTVPPLDLPSGNADIVGEETPDGWPTLELEPWRGVIDEHNRRTAEFAKDTAAAADRYKLFVLGAHREQYKTLQASFEEARARERRLSEEKTRLEQRIRELSGGEFDPGPGVKWLNDELCRLLGRDELELQVLDDRNYVITRHGAKVDHLSEGEKTALALLHFLGSLEDRGRDAKDLCVVIDDPISSLDSDIAFGASAVLWGNLLGMLSCRCGGDEACKCPAGKRMRVDQLILFTHSFDFFRNWSNQLDRLPASLFKNNSGLSYVQLELRTRWRAIGNCHRRVPEWTTFGATGRYYKSSNDDGYKERTRLRSEYHYLFHRCATAMITLNTGSATTEEQMDAESLLPNASRRLLEGFLAHRHPEHMGGKFRESLKAGLSHNADNPTRVLLDSYLNRFSHNEEATMGTTLHRPETAKMLTFVFDYLHRLDPRHFHGMCTALKLDPHALLPRRTTAFSQEELAGRTLCHDEQCPFFPWQEAPATSHP